MATMQDLMTALRKADAAGDAEAARQLARMIQDAQQQQNAAQAQADQQESFQQLLREQAEEMGTVESVLVGAGKTFTDIGRGAQGIWAGLTGDDERVEELKALQASEAELYQPLREVKGKSTFVGEMLPYLATAPLGGAQGAAAATAARTGAAGAGRALGMYAGEQAALGGLQGALGAPVGQAGTGGAIGGALGGAMPLVGRGLGALGGRARGAVQAAREATEAGVPLTPGQRLGSGILTKLEEAYSSIPGMGAAFGSVKRGQQRAINNMAARSIGETTDSLTGDLLESAGKRIGQQFDDIIAEQPIYRFNRDVVQNLRRQAGQITADELDSPVAKKLINRILNRARAGQSLPAKEYQKINTRIGKKLKGLGIDPDEREMLIGLKETLDDLVEAQLPATRLEALQLARSQWRNLRDLEKVTDTVSGNVSGAKLANRLERVRGPGALQGSSPLAQAGRYGRELRPTVADSGTATRALPWLAGGAAAYGEGDTAGLGGTLLGAALAPWAYRGAGRALASPLQAGVGRSLQAMSQPASINVGRSLGAGLVPGLLEE